MKELAISKIYAKAFLELGDEHKFNTAQELENLTMVINSSNNLENVLFLDVFSLTEKKSVFEAIAKKISLSAPLVQGIKYLINERRIGLLPMITKEVIVFDDHKKGFLRGTIEGHSDEVSEELKNKVLGAVTSKLKVRPVLTYKANKKITAGLRVTVEDFQIDATLDTQLNELKKSIVGEQLL